jgi:metal-sulfur cluster biosynthetic enzyme
LKIIKEGLVIKNISEKDVRQAIGQVMHPEISLTLVELGMVKDVTLRDDEVSLSLVLPFLGIPASIKDYLVNSLRQAVMKLGAKAEIKIAEMNQEERLAFLAMEQEGWRGLG